METAETDVCREEDCRTCRKYIDGESSSNIYGRISYQVCQAGRFNWNSDFKRDRGKFCNPSEPACEGIDYKPL